ncbi:glycoside hydrolase family 9 protein [Rhodohalobacter sp. 8-1]|uniref:glycoside hydrolase family 9 protein n=1 Tax=Rhodohalobacter sp. 8-1 TaxID=3131972 RepID=UPI0030EED48C
MIDKLIVPILFLSILLLSIHQPAAGQELKIGENDYFEARGVNVFVFSNRPGGMFFDAKTSGIEIIHHGERTATNGDVRFLRTPEQWDGLGEFVNRTVDIENNTIETHLEYPEYEFLYRVKAEARDNGLAVSVHLDEPLPEELAGEAGFNMEFLPSAYFGKSYLMDGKGGLFPRHPTGPMNVKESGLTEPFPIARGQKLVLAPNDSERHITIEEVTGETELMLLDGRNKAQNGWYVVRSLIPEGADGKVIEWFLEIHTQPDWIRQPVIGHSQVGYHPDQKKVAVIELDPNDEAVPEARLVKVTENGDTREAHRGQIENWGSYLRYNYATYDFTDVKEPGLYAIEYDGSQTQSFRIDPDVYGTIWHQTLDIFFPVQMDHMRVREAYRVWHGASHLDDALQAPPDYEHFDLYRHGESTDTNFEPFEHISGLNYGGWYDAGDYDIRTQSQYSALQNLVHTQEQFGINRDNTTVSQETMYTEIHRPDGNPDILQQIEHGALGLIAQYRAIGHAIPGIVAGHLYQYTHLGDGSTKTDNKIYDPELDPFSEERGVGDMYLPSTDAPAPEDRVMQTEENHSGHFDDRWAFTTNTSALNYGSAAALAAASRTLRGYNDELAEEVLETALGVWEYEQNREPNLFRHGNTTGGRLVEEQLKLAVELLIATEDQQYADAVREILPDVEDRFGSNAFMLIQAMPYLDGSYTERLRELTAEYRASISGIEDENPYGVPITRGGWAGNGTIINFSITNYWLHRTFPDIVEADLALRGLNYIFGTHPESNYSFVSGVGARSQLVAYGTNRADFSFTPGGIVPGVLILRPDFPENKDNWPFFWGQNEYVITVGASYLFLAHAVQDLLSK